MNTNSSIESLKKNINSVILGKEETVENVLCCFLAGGHVLLEDVPGVGKTTLAKSFADACSLSFGRIQFTPDTMPGDVTGLTVYNMKNGEFEYRQGAIMKNVVLADELNRTSPKTQSALLEAMAEGHVTVDGKVYGLPDPFIVIATQNPISFAGTYPLPEAQLDRFMMRLSVGYPAQEAELDMLKSRMENRENKKTETALKKEEIAALKKEVEKIHISEKMLAYMQDIVLATRSGNDFVLGASPRALIHLMEAARAKAYVKGRDFVKPDDIKQIAVPVLSHRLVITTEARLRKKTAAELLNILVTNTKIPVE